MLIYPTIKMAPILGFPGFGGGATSLAFGGASGPVQYEFYLWGGGGGGGSQNRIGTSYHTTTYYKAKEGGAGGLVYVKFEFTAGTQIVLTVGGGGRGAGKQGNGTRSNGGYNGGGLGAVSNNDAGGGGGGFTGLFLGNGNSDKTAARAIAISPGGGGGAGGPGYQNATNEYSNGGGGIDSDYNDGRGQRGTRGNSTPTRLAQPGTPTAGGERGEGPSGGQYGTGANGTLFNGGDGEIKNNSWGSGGGGGGGWFGGGAGGDDGGNWGGQGGASGSAFVRGSGITYTSDGNSALANVTYVSHTFYKQTYGYDGDGTNNRGTGGYYNMNMPVETGNARYPGSSCAYGGLFDTSPSDNVGNDGYMGAIVYRKVGDSNWTTLYNSGHNSSSLQTVLTV
tara:strand:- start:299 stop:1477 length:1179 start_codon:yes stop_codon:yes gene_type:complete